MEDMGGNGNGNDNGNGNSNANANAKGKGEEPMEPSLESNNNRIPPPPPPPPYPPQQCPRCFSTTTKFCYYNNRSVTQPRYHCKSCKRHWTHGGSLRNIPIGGGSRKGTKKMGKGNPSSGSSSFYVGESSRAREHISPQQQPQPPQSTAPPPLLAHMRAFSNNGMSFSNSFLFQGGISSPFAGIHNFNLLQGFNQVPMNGGGGGGGGHFGGTEGTPSASLSLLQGSSGSPNLTRPSQIQQPVYQSHNGQQVMAQPSRALGSLSQALINHPSGSIINASLAGSNNVAGFGSTTNFPFLWSDEFYVDGVNDLFSGSSPPPPSS